MFRRIMDNRITFHMLFWGNVAFAISSALQGEWGSAAMSGSVATFMLTVW